MKINKLMMFFFFSAIWIMQNISNPVIGFSSQTLIILSQLLLNIFVYSLIEAWNYSQVRSSFVCNMHQPVCERTVGGL